MYKENDVAYKRIADSEYGVGSGKSISNLHMELRKCIHVHTVGCFSEDIAFAHHFVVTPTIPTFRSASGIDYPSKIWQRFQLRSYPFNS